MKRVPCRLLRPTKTHMIITTEVSNWVKSTVYETKWLLHKPRRFDQGSRLLSNYRRLVSLFNSSSFRRDKALTMYIFSRSAKTQQAFLEETSCGSVCVNDTIMQFTGETALWFWSVVFVARHFVYPSYHATPHILVICFYFLILPLSYWLLVVCGTHGIYNLVCSS